MLGLAAVKRHVKEQNKLTHYQGATHANIHYIKNCEM